jgi:hypothetical protein
MGGGIFLTTTAATVNAAIDHTRLHANGSGLRAKGTMVASVRDSDAIGNVGAGFWADAAPAEISFDGVRASGAWGAPATGRPPGPFAYSTGCAEPSRRLPEALGLPPAVALGEAAREPRYRTLAGFSAVGSRSRTAQRHDR